MSLFSANENHKKEDCNSNSAYISCNVGTIIPVYNHCKCHESNFDIELVSFFSIISDFDSIRSDNSFVDLDAVIDQLFYDSDDLYEDSESAKHDIQKRTTEIRVQIGKELGKDAEWKYEGKQIGKEFGKDAQWKYEGKQIGKELDKDAQWKYEGKQIGKELDAQWKYEDKSIKGTEFKYDTNDWKYADGLSKSIQRKENIYKFPESDKIYKSTLKINLGTSEFERQFEEFDVYDYKFKEEKEKYYDLKGQEFPKTKSLKSDHLKDFGEKIAQEQQVKRTWDQDFPEQEEKEEKEDELRNFNYLAQQEKAYEFRDLYFPEQPVEVHQYIKSEPYISTYQREFEKSEHEKYPLLQKKNSDYNFYTTSSYKYMKRKTYDLGNFEDLEKKADYDEYTTKGICVPSSINVANVGYQKHKVPRYRKATSENKKLDESLKRVEESSKQNKYETKRSYFKNEKKWLLTDGTQYLPLEFDPNLNLITKSVKEAWLMKDKRLYKHKTPLFIKELPTIPFPQALTVPTILTFGGISLDDPSDISIGKIILGYHPLLNQWGYAGHMVEPRNHHTIAIIKDDIFIIGGCDPELINNDEMMTTNCVLSYNIRERRWKRCADMLTPRSHHSSIVADQMIYSIGGRDHEGRILQSIEKYDLDKNQWTEMRQMPYPVMGSASCLLHHHIMIIGGVTSNEKHQSITSAVLFYNTKDNSWSFGPELPFPIAYASSTCASTGTWLFGGVTTNKEGLESLITVFILDIKKKKWLDARQLSSPRHSVASVSIESCAYVIGGVTTYNNGSVDKLDAIEGIGKQTISLASLPIPLTGTAAIVLKPFILSAYTGAEIYAMVTKTL